ncbi:MAG: kinase inhibitor, partial [Gammaproteobacteria bacterium]|nr:kinase inhibitor [Gammaproteobacteria bacterium]
NATELPQGAGNSSNALPEPAHGGGNDFLDTRETGVNGNYGEPSPPTVDKPHRYVFTLYALAVADVEAAGGIPKTGTPALHSFILNKGLGGKLLGKASFTARYQR